MRKGSRFKPALINSRRGAPSWPAREAMAPAPPTWPDWKVRHAGRPWYVRGPLAIEWGLEWFYHRLRGLALFDLLELAGRCAVLVIAIFWLLEADDRTKERHYRAWELINSARGSTGDGGRKDALQDLNRDGVSLAGAPLEKAYLPGVDLEGVNLVKANLEGASLSGANLKSADLSGANLERGYLQDANLENAYLGYAGLRRADLSEADLQGADLFTANLESADLRQAKLVGAHAREANLKGARLSYADLRGANLHEANLEAASLANANLEGANLRYANLRGADLYRTNLTHAACFADLEGADLTQANVEGATFWRIAPDGHTIESAKGLTQEQIDAAIGDEQTQLPEGLTRPEHWLKNGDEGSPAAKE